MTAALEGGEWSAARPGRNLPPGKTRYPFYRRLDGPQGRSGRAENLVATGIQSRSDQSVVGPYTDWAFRPTVTTTRDATSSKKCSRYRPGVVQRVGRGIALLFHDRGTRRG